MYLSEESTSENNSEDGSEMVGKKGEKKASFWHHQNKLNKATL